MSQSDMCLMSPMDQPEQSRRNHTQPALKLWVLRCQSCILILSLKPLNYTNNHQSFYLEYIIIEGKSGADTELFTIP